jgi:DNA mismatch endonuclease, patch repair protein
VLVRKFLFSKGFRYRLHDKKLPGKPDIILPKYETVIFIHGCFWHGHEGCKYFVIPKTRTEWWLNKINGNIANDKKKQLTLQEIGWKVLQVWECELKSVQVGKTLNKLLQNIEV